MLTLITGTPGSGKSLYAVWEIARKIPGSTMEIEGEAKSRRLLSNIKNLRLDHEVIGAAELNTWQTWARPGDVIVYDEVQEVWRPRTMGSKIPDCVAALETHRHLGVDIILITQHPLLVDPNIRRLVNQHFHLRRVTRRMATVYEWDHCSNISSFRDAVQSRVWWHPRAGYDLYKSALAHTKPTQRLPRIAWLGLLLLAVGAYAVPGAFGRIQRSFGMGDPVVAAAPAAAASAPSFSHIERRSDPPRLISKLDQTPPANFETRSGFPGKFQRGGDHSRLNLIAGCVVSASRECQCVTGAGDPVPRNDAMCEALTARPVLGAGRLDDYDVPQLYLPGELARRHAVNASDDAVMSWMASNRPGAKHARNAIHY